MRLFNSLTAFFLASLLSVCFAADIAAQEAQNPNVATVKAVDVRKSDERYRIGYQDVLSVTVFTTQPRFAETVSVAPDGTIRLSRIPDPISVVCKTEQELASEITELYKRHVFKNPFVSVRAVEQRSQAVAVIGAVVKPGLYYLNQKATLLQMLSFAGGHDVQKAGTKLIVARTGSNSTCQQDLQTTADSAKEDDIEVFQYSIKDVLQNDQNPWMQPGDIISVLDADVVYVYGNVNKQGEIKLTRPLTLRQAIATAGGFAPSSKKDKIKILRQKQGSAEWEPIIFDLKEIDGGKVQDPFLLPNDIVAVSEDSMKSILRTVGRSLTGGIPSIFYRIP
jgi:polysaccharide biosynthesis/export protein